MAFLDVGILCDALVSEYRQHLHHQRPYQDLQAIQYLYQVF